LVINGSGEVKWEDDTAMTIIDTVAAFTSDIPQQEESRWITICHYSNAGGSRTIRITVSAWENHRDNHGDTKGPCESTPEPPIIIPPVVPPVDPPVDPPTPRPEPQNKINQTDLDTPTNCRLFPVITREIGYTLFVTNVDKRASGFAVVDVFGEGYSMRYSTTQLNPGAGEELYFLPPDEGARYLRVTSFNADIRTVLEKRMFDREVGLNLEYGQECVIKR
jgi:hypothetical protein